MNRLEIILHRHIDQPMIDNGITDDDFNIDVRQNYAGEVASSVVLKITDLDSTYQDAVKAICDRFSNEFETSALVWQIVRTGKTFDLSESFVRDAVSTGGTLTRMTSGTPLKVRFDIPGFEANGFREIDLLYGQAFSGGDIAEVLELGITLTGDGDSFTIANTVECKVSFSKPSGESAVYVIDYQQSNDVIAV